MTNPSPTNADEELNQLLDSIQDYLPDEMQGLNHHDLPEAKAALLAWRQTAVDTAVREAREVLIQSYEAKVQDFASETRRTTELMQTLHEVRNSLMDYHHSSGFHAKNCDRCAAVEIIEAALHLTQEEGKTE